MNTKLVYFEDQTNKYNPMRVLAESSKESPSNIIIRGSLAQQVVSTASQTAKSITRCFVLDGKYLWCGTDESGSNFQWRLETKLVKLLLPPKLASKYRQQPDPLDRSKLAMRLCYRDHTWIFYAEDSTRFDAWVAAFSKVLIRTDIHERFKIHKTIGVGTTAKVYLATEVFTKQRFAIKGFNKEFYGKRDKGTQSLLNEIAILRKLDHPNVSKLHEVHETENSVYLVFDHYPGGELYKLIKSRKEISSQEATHLMHGLLLGLQNLETMHVVHRDIKPSNILLRKTENLEAGDVVIADFGLSTFKNEKNLLYHKCGTPGHVAPEIIQSTSQDELPTVDPKVDVYSAGVVLYMLLAGKNPFLNDGHIATEEVLDRNSRSAVNYSNELLKNKDPRLLFLLRTMLKPEPDSRPSASQCLTCSLFKSPQSHDRDYSHDTEEFESLEKDEILSRFSVLDHNRLKSPSRSSHVASTSEISINPSFLFERPGTLKQTPRVNLYQTSPLLKARTGQTGASSHLLTQTLELPGIKRKTSNQTPRAPGTSFSNLSDSFDPSSPSLSPRHSPPSRTVEIPLKNLCSISPQRTATIQQ